MSGEAEALRAEWSKPDIDWSQAGWANAIRRSPWARCFTALAILAAAFLLLSPPAMAWPWDTLFDDIVSKGAKAAVAGLTSIDTGMLTNDFTNLFGKDSTAYNTVKDAAETVTKVLGYSVLSIVCVIELMKIGVKLDRGQVMGALPGFKDLIMLLVFFAVMKIVVDNAVPLCASVYDLVNGAVKTVNDGLSGGTGLAKVLDPESDANAGWIKSFSDTSGNLLVSILALSALALECLIAEAITYFALIARSLQLYVYAIMAPVALMFLGGEHTRQWGIGFIKNFLALCLAGIIIALVLGLLPGILSGVVNGLAAPTGAGVDVLTDAAERQKFAILGTLGVFIYAMGKSGSWARDILGG